MRTFAALGLVGVVVASIVVACAGDDAKHVRDGDGGGAGRGDGGVAGLGQGAGENEPTLGGAGAGAAGGGAGAATSGGAGGATGTSGEGGMGAAAPGSDGGAGGAIACEREVDQNYTCAQVEADWAPVWNTLQSRFEFDVSSLPFPIANGTVSYFVNNADFTECGTVDVTVSGSMVYAPVTITNVKLSPTDVRVSMFSLNDVCGNHRDFDPRGVPNCNDLRGSGNFGSWALTCSTRFDATCPEVCVNQ
ncbi:MAG TPA: hypothetical protein VHP33_24100 [Polyangiaceae bacterium]|nr:hypothetical protein [Polyangiaceae bacterium]